MVAVLHGAVVGGGLELAAACHLRVAERSAYYALPEGSRGIFVGGGGSVRLPRLIGVSRMMELMLTGRTYGAEEGQAIGLSHYLVETARDSPRASSLPSASPSNAPLSNFAIMHALPRIAESDPASGLSHRIADGRDRPGQRRGQGAAEGFSGEARQEGASRMSCRGDARRESIAARRCGRCSSGRRDVLLERKADGTIYLRSPHPLAAYPDKLTRAAGALGQGRARPRVPGAARAGRLVAQADLRADARAGARASRRRCCARKLSPERPIAILSGNDIEHALLGLAAMMIGIPYAPISVPYSLMSSDFGKLKSIIEIADAGPRLRRRRQGVRARHRGGGAARRRDRRHRQSAGERPATLFADLLAAQPTAAVDAAHAKVGPDTIAKILFTSGSTGNPKGVINTQRMLCSNQAMIRATLAFIADEPPVLVDWPPWNHTFGGNHDFGMVLHNGGSFYIDEGKPLPGAIEATVRNLREIAPTIYFNVPKGFEMLLPYLRSRRGVAAELLQPAEGAVLRRRGAGAARLGRVAGDGGRHHRRAHHLPVQPRLDRDRAGRARPHLGIRAARQYRPADARRGAEARAAATASSKRGCKGPNITPGYWRRPDLTKEAFDDEGFYKIGDALKFDDARRSRQGPAVRRPPRRGFQARQRHLGQRRRAARRSSSIIARRWCATR